MAKIDALMRMDDQSVVITGGNGHLGRAIAETLVELGAHIILIDRPNSDFRQIQSILKKVNPIDHEMIECDIEDDRQRSVAIDHIMESGGQIGCLINAAAFTGDTSLEGWTSPFETQSLITWRRALEVNLTAAFHFSQGLTPALRLAGDGNIINITSIYGEFGPNWDLYSGTNMGNPAAYSASKGGLCQLSRWLSTTLAPDIRVNSISPGGIFRGQPAAFVRSYNQKTPLKRMAAEEDLIGAVTYLATKMSRYVTGQTLRVDGGWSAW